MVTMLVWLGFVLAAGWAGFWMYLGVIVSVSFSVQIVTYLQHWGLGTDNVETADTQHFAWEDTCRFQSWLTFGLSFHQGHHRSTATVFYRIELSDDSPRQPAGYAVLLLLCMAPPLWRALMLPILDRWKQRPTASRAPGRRHNCFSTDGR